MRKKDNTRSVTSVTSVMSSCQVALLIKFLLICTAITVTGSSRNDICSCGEADEYNMIHIKNILESTPEGTVIKNLNFIGGDKILLSSTESKLPNIVFDNITQAFNIKKKFNVTNSTPLLLDDIKVICTIVATNQKIIYNVFIEVHDENDNAPIFIDLPYVFNISEATPQGSTILPEIKAIDADPSDVGKLTYSVREKDDYWGYFNFTIPSIGRLTLGKELNFEVVRHIELIVEVKDNSYNESVLGRTQPQHITSTNVTVNVLSVFGNMLQYIKTSYTLKISNFDQDILIDASIQNEKDLEFNLVSDTGFDDWKYFQVTNTGFLRIVDILTRTQYILLLKVKKRLKSIFMTSLIVIDVIMPAKFLNPTTNLILAENTLIGTFVAKMETSNHKGTTKFFFTKEIAETEFFHLEPSSGVITTSQNLDKISKNVFNITVGFSNYPNKQDDTALLNITISRIVDSNPKFSRDFYDFKYINSTIGQVQASDPMTSFPISYRLLDIYKKFSVDRNGMISCEECNSIGDPILGLVVIAEAETPFNRSDSALVIIRLSSKSDAWFAAFIISIVLAFILFVLFVILVVLLCSASRRGPAARDIRKALFNSKIGKIGCEKCCEIKSISSNVSQAETSSVKQLVHKESATSDTSLVEPRLHPSSNLTVPKKQDKTDWTSSQETINASNMTLTRPAVGTDGITLYY